MQPMEIIQTAIKQGQKALSEYQSKQLLSQFGLPVCREKLVTSAKEAVAFSREVGLPVVLKGCAHDLMHKSEGGFVELFLRTEKDVEDAFDRIAKKGKDQIQGVLVQEMVFGQREVLVGLVRDAQFGPCVMLGLGGVMAEALEDTAFRMAPVSVEDARDMAVELRSSQIFGEFRGQKAVDMDQLAGALIALGKIGLEIPQVAEIDINPMIIDKDGHVAAVDALVVLNGKGDKK